MASSSSAKGKGRKKIKMEKMQNQSNLQASFSKHRQGAFKKAHELSILTGSEVASIIYSPGGKVYTYGHPTIDSVIHRFLTGSPQPLTISQKIAQNEHNVKVIEINTKLDEVKSKTKDEKKIIEEIKKIWVECQINQVGNFNWDEQDPSKSQQLAEGIKNTKVEVDREINAQVYPQQNNIPLVVAYNNISSESRFSSLSLVGPTYERNGNNNTYKVTYLGNNGSDNRDGKFYTSLLRHTSHGVGTSRNVLLGSTGLGFNGNGGGLSFNNEHSLFSGNDGGNGTFNAGLSSFIGEGGGLPNAYMNSSTGVGGYGLDWSLSGMPNQLGQFVRPCNYVEGGSGVSFSNTYGASSSVVGNNNGGYGSSSNSYMNTLAGVSGGDIGLSFSVVSNPLGQFNGPNTYVRGGSGDGLPKNYWISSSDVRNNNSGYGRLRNSCMAHSSASDGVGLGRSLSDFPNSFGEFLRPTTYIGGGTGNVFSNTYEDSSSYLGNDDGCFNDKAAD